MPEDVASEKGNLFDVILIIIKDSEIYSYAETLADEKSFSKLTKEEIGRIIHEPRGSGKNV